MSDSCFSKMAFYQRIQEFLDKEGMTANKFEQQIGMRGALTRWKRDDDKDFPTVVSLIRTSDVLGVTIDWLVTGRHPKIRKSRILQPVITVVGDFPDLPPNVHPEDYLAVPLVSADIAAQYSEMIPDDFVISLVWLYMPEVGSRNSHFLRAVRLAKTSSSSQPDIAAGDIVIIDPTERPFAKPLVMHHLYAIYSPEEGGCAVKRVWEDRDLLILTSDNPCNGPTVIRPGDKSTPVMGQVLWSWRSWI